MSASETAIAPFDGSGLRLFLSVDVCGSTSYKDRNQNFTDYHAHWARFYEVFFADFPISFYGHFERVAEAHNLTPSRPEHWKSLGDELLFTAPIKDIEETLVLVKAFYKAISALDEDFRVKFKLRLKGAAWTAGFPIRNSTLKINSPNGEKFKDFIGPDIDIGFRVAACSRPGRLVVSMDLADILAQTKSLECFVFHHVGWEVFRGVFNSHPYPIIWASEKNSSPKQPPWAEFTCALTRAAKDDALKDAQTLRLMIRSIREELPDLNLFAPYFDESGMPTFHKKIAETWRREAGKTDSIDFGAGDFGDKPISLSL